MATAFDSSSGAGGSDSRYCSVTRTQPMSSDTRPVGASVPSDELGRAAADVDDEVRRGRVEIRGRAEEGQLRLLLTRDELGCDAERLVRGVEEHVTVRPRRAPRSWPWRGAG